MFEYHFVRFTPRYKKQVMEFLESLSPETKTALSTSGIDSKVLYLSFRTDRNITEPTILFKNKEILALGKLSYYGKKKMYISCLVVKDSYQKQGWGTKMVQYLCALAKIKGASEIYTETLKINKGGFTFFQKLGFSLEEEEIFTYVLRRKL